MARQMTCDCGEVLTGVDDNELMQLGGAHAAAKHPEMNITEEQGRALVAAKAVTV